MLGRILSVAMLLAAGPALAANEPIGREGRGEPWLPQLGAATGGPGGSQLGPQTLADGLGDEWRVSGVAGGLNAARAKSAPATDESRRELAELIDETKKEQRLLSLKVKNERVSILGTARGCDELVEAVAKLSRIRGVNRIEIGAACAVRR